MVPTSTRFRTMSRSHTAADIGASGPRGMLRAQALALLFASVLRTWTNDEDEGLARTIAYFESLLAEPGIRESLAD